MRPLPGPSSPGRLRPLLRDLVDASWSLVTTTAGLAIGVGLVDGVSVDEPLALPGAALLVFAADALLRPVLRRAALLGSAMVALFLGLLAQVALLLTVLPLAPGVSTGGWRDSLAVLLVAVTVMAAGRWLVGSADSSYVLGHVLHRGRSRRRADGPDPGDGPAEGLLVVQLDGVSRAVLERAVEAGQAPTVARWLASGSHTLSGWWAQVPSTTPASQAGLLHGDDRQVPAFRWWDRGLGRLVVSNRPADAALVESRMSTGAGLLAGGGVAVSTMFSGDAATSLLVMSQARAHRGLGPGTAYVRFFASPFVLSRALLLTGAEMVKELYQARRQRVRDVLPRVPRRGSYVLLRGATNVLLRDLTLALVAEHLVKGAPSVFVDLVDYDEIAHHAGPERPEALRALEGLDGVLALLEQVEAAAPRPYRVVVLSDHGQSLGATFEQVEGRSLTDVVRALMDVAPEQTVQAREGEEWGPVNALLAASPGRRSSAGGAVVGPDRERGEARTPRRPARERPAGDQPATAGASTNPSDLPELAVTASGSLGTVWFPRLAARPDLDLLHRLWPHLVPGLLALPSVGVVVVGSAEHGPVALGALGAHHLRTGFVDGEDPLAPYSDRAAADLLHLSTLEHCGDLVLLSSVGLAPHGGRVHAFEGLVGSHGGLGGLQNDALLLHPGDWRVDADLLDDVDGTRRLVGAVAVHRQLLRWSGRGGTGADAPVRAHEEDPACT